MAMRITQDEIDHRFGFHKATNVEDFPYGSGHQATLPRHRETRLLFREFVSDLLKITGQDQGREVATMLTKLQEASMWAHCAIAMDAPLVEE